MQTITISHVDGSTSQAKITPAVQVAFEREYKVGIAALADTATLRMEYMYWLAWHATTAGRPNRPTFDQWLETVSALGDPEDVDVVPLGETQPSGTSLPSPSNPVPV